MRKILGVVAAVMLLSGCATLGIGGFCTVDDPRGSVCEAKFAPAGSIQSPGSDGGNAGDAGDGGAGAGSGSSGGNGDSGCSR